MTKHERLVTLFESQSPTSRPKDADAPQDLDSFMVRLKAHLAANPPQKVDAPARTLAESFDDTPIPALPDGVHARLARAVRF